MKEDVSISIDQTIRQLKKLDKRKFYFVGAKLLCPHCEMKFGINIEYVGVVTCPYGGKYVEG
jgi:hypothetical protein